MTTSTLEIYIDDVQFGYTPSPVVQHSLQYVICASHSVSKTLKYSVLSTHTPITKVLGYAIKTHIAIVPSLQYTVPTTHIIDLHAPVHTTLTTSAPYFGQFIYSDPTLPLWITFSDVNEPITQYSFGSMGHPYFNFYPTAWTFQGSNDGSSWTTLDTRTASEWGYIQIDSYVYVEIRTFTFSNSVPYRYYKLHVTTKAAPTPPPYYNYLYISDPKLYLDLVPLKYVMYPPGTTLHQILPTLQYTVKSFPKITKSLLYKVRASPIISEPLSYTVCQSQLPYDLQYTVCHTIDVTTTLQYIIPYIVIEASLTFSDKIPVNIQFQTTTESGILPSWLWNWDFDGDVGSSLVGATSNIIHQFLDYGEYDITCVAATLTGGASATIHISIVERTLPTAVIYYYKHPGNHIVDFYGTYSTDALTYEWDFGDGTAHDFNMNPTHTYAADDNYDITLTVTNGAGSDVATGVVYYLPDLPVADFEMEDTPLGSTTTIPYNVSLTVTDILGRSDTTTKTYYVRHGPFTKFKDLSTGSIKYWEWDFGDGMA
jgi:PKD repeat protein